MSMTDEPLRHSTPSAFRNYGTEVAALSVTPLEATKKQLNLQNASKGYEAFQRDLNQASPFFDCLYGMIQWQICLINTFHQNHLNYL